MLRLAEGLDETLLFLAPFIAYMLFHLIFIRGYRPPGWMILLLALGLGLIGAGLVWEDASQGLRRGERYVPAIQGPGGEVVQGHGSPSR